jgi:hypothetical protein
MNFFKLYFSMTIIVLLPPHNNFSVSRNERLFTEFSVLTNKSILNAYFNLRIDICAILKIKITVTVGWMVNEEMATLDEVTAHKKTVTCNAEMIMDGRSMVVNATYFRVWL